MAHISSTNKEAHLDLYSKLDSAKLPYGSKEVISKCVLSWYFETILLSHSSPNFQFIHLLVSEWTHGFLYYSGDCSWPLPLLFILISMLILIGPCEENQPLL